MRNFKYLLCVSLTLTGCAPELSNKEIKACFQKVDQELVSASYYKKYENTPFDGNQIEYIQGNLYKDVKTMHDEMSNYLSNPDKYGTVSEYLPFNFKEECRIDSLVSYAKEQIFYKERDRALEQADAANTEIDKALDDVIGDYKKQSVKHFTSNGAGNIKVDTFVLKNGKTVYCKTSITDAGKAVDCSE